MAELNAAEYRGCHMYYEDSDDIIQPATDVFEIQDFTAATDWENFIDELENVLRSWRLAGTPRPGNQLDRADFSRLNWRRSAVAELKYLNFPFSIQHFQLDIRENSNRGQQEEEEEEMIQREEGEPLDDPDDGNTITSAVMTDLSSSAGDFMSKGPTPAYLYGLREFILISPAGKEILGNETRAGQVVGAVNIALHGTDCRVPVLVQVMEPTRQLFLGTAIVENTRTELSGVSLSKRPQHAAHLTGLLQLFKNRISSPLPVELSPVTVSARLSYELEDWSSYAWSVDPPDLDLFSLSGDSDFIQLKETPFGCIADPVSKLTLFATWRDLSEDLITDNAIHTDLDPLEAPEWSVCVALLEQPDCLLAKHLDDFLQLCADVRSVKQLLGDLAEEEADTADGRRLPDVLDRLAAGGGGQPPIMLPSVSLSDLADKMRPLRGRGRSPTGGPLKRELLQTVLAYLFPDAEAGGSASAPYPPELCNSELGELEGNSSAQYAAKAGPPEGLVARLAKSLACCLAWRGGVAGAAHLLHEFCLEVRYRWEQGLPLPGLGPVNAVPDTATCLLQQKLVLLNYCIGRRNSAKQHISREEEEEEMEASTNHDSDTDYEEFFDAEDEDEEPQRGRSGNGGQLAAWETAEGRAERVGQLRLLSGADWLYRPLLQEPAPLTEDELAEQAEVLMQLGSDQAGSEVRARLQSAQLLSDMESFKAANPGCVLADFVRWHSPRDWEEGSGLSARMQLPGNMWTELWEQARAVPAHRQRRLFDETREGEKVLQFFTSLSPGDAAQLLLPLLLQAAHMRTVSVSKDIAPSIADLHAEIGKAVIQTSRLLCLPEVRHFRGNIHSEEFQQRAAAAARAVSLIRLAEVKISRLLSLRRKFIYDLTLKEEEEEHKDALQEMHRFVKSLVVGGEVKVAGAARGPAGRLIQSIFKESDQVEHPRPCGIPPPVTRQFILRTVAARPLPASRPTPQRLYARLGPGEFVLAGAFTIDRQYL